MDTLNVLIFFFSLVVIMFPVLTMAPSYLVYSKTKNKLYLYTTLLLITFIIDAVFLHYTDFYHSSTTVLPDTFISLAPFKIVLFSVMLSIEMLIILNIFQKQIKVKYFIIIIIFIALEIIFKTMNENNLTIWLFYTTRQFFTIVLCVYFYYAYIRCKDSQIKSYAKKFISIFALFILLNFIICIEDALVSSQQQAFSSSGLIFKERNFTENLYWMVITSLIFISTFSIINNLVFPTKEKKTSLNTDAFVNEIQLTKREKEIFLLILEHYGNMEIADKLCISSGTLKAHIHNIYAKANVTHRNELIKKVNDVIETNKIQTENK
ncbi:DNA-binding CsgD family transcriptional regulator [Breznakia sp. PF5-3]|uniref:response regulator transcription factor n=1 Tax=unclassified Breznakia TaxID=2623764 RepID=UPI002405B9CE|nr:MULTISPECIES: helix-turn-helix transcriptional regulator [unclassified Breznakia]MDF9824605.1 DNA-binding CsgD family transcriptional regulator [Breznakia sp. PM6-1]MDF9835541.1 DNA-binding CsgD family transcriptional regulator [Breznakia sp. PF5-3]MDF9837957.1 DNA-binding CsgD family transcriptional regulator [Breznakia sp. PFB2-8]MDF9859946.1 DNA-binding CsgD family transcriptional regulator [Breznakia sp. PH5-24]